MLYQNNTIYLFQSTTTMAWTLAEVAASSEEGEVAASSEEGEVVASSEEAGEGAEADGTSTSSRGPGSFGPGTRQGPEAGSVTAATPTARHFIYCRLSGPS